jgi:hypothetical protein
VTDLVLILVLVLFFALGVAYVALCDRIASEDPEDE